MKNLTTFEFWVKKIITESENQLDSDEEENQFPAEHEMTWGEKIAYARDFQLLSKAQMAGLYLKALEKIESSPGKYLRMVPSLLNYGKINQRGEYRFTAKNLAEALGIISTPTAVRTVLKFEKIMLGLPSSDSEMLYPKILKAYKEFDSQSPISLIPLIENIIKKSVGPRQLVAAIASKNNSIKIGEKVYYLMKELSKNPIFSDREKAQRTAIKKIAQENNFAEDFVLSAYHAYMKLK